MWAIFANSFLFFLSFNNLFNEYVVANALAPLKPKPQPIGRLVFILISRASLALFNFLTTLSTVGNLVVLLLKKMIVLSFIFLIDTVTPLSTVKPTPKEPFLAGLLFSTIEKMQLMLPGAKAFTIITSFLCCLRFCLILFFYQTGQPVLYFFPYLR